MLPMMIFGMTALGMIMVPIGFQLLAMLGGKALLLSKMALLLASINGLKRVRHSISTQSHWYELHFIHYFPFLFWNSFIGCFQWHSLWTLSYRSTFSTPTVGEKRTSLQSTTKYELKSCFHLKWIWNGEISIFKNFKFDLIKCSHQYVYVLIQNQY